MQKLVPLEDRIVVRADDAEQKSAGGIIIPDNAQEKPQRGTVLEAGFGRWADGQHVPTYVAAGDKVLFSKFGGTAVTVNGEELLILSSRDVLAIVQEVEG